MNMKQIQLTKEKTALVDDEDYEVLKQYKWFADWNKSIKYWYARTRVYDKVTKKSVNLSMHRMVTGAAKGEVVDHINNNTLDNTKSNLRICTHSQNHMNSTKQANNTSGFKGVCWNKRKSKWMAQIGKDGMHINIGYYKTAEQAYYAYLKKSKELHGEFMNKTLHKDLLHWENVLEELEKNV
jgi:hypothetical protein